jgi:DNA-binding XRE family transcriptional regulator
MGYLWMLAGLGGASTLPKSLRSRRHRALVAVLVGSRKDAGLTQRQVAAKWKRPQSTVAAIESGERRLDVVEFFELAQALGVDPVALFERVARW